MIARNPPQVKSISTPPAAGPQTGFQRRAGGGRRRPQARGDAVKTTRRPLCGAVFSGGGGRVSGDTQAGMQALKFAAG